MPVDKSKFSNLTKKGFRKDEQTRHTFFHFYHDGERTRHHTYISRTPKLKTYPDNLLSRVKKQLGLKTNQEVKDLLNCPMSEQDYIEKIEL